MRCTTMSAALLLGALLLLPETSRASAPPQNWLTDYSQAAAQARREKKMLLILFCASCDASRCDSLEKGALLDPRVREKLNGVVRLRVPLDAEIRPGGKAMKLIDHSSLAEMLGRQGIAMIDYAHKKADYYETVVSCFPMMNNQPYSADKVLVMLGLPPGTLTQRTVIYAVRTHPECPASTEGQFNSDLAEEAESHSIYQASIRLQGHHNWERRFYRINGELGNGATASEVCAESWPGEGLLQGAIECVRSWRLSAGHWRAVRSRHRCYGYDIQRGNNGIWYATGIFGGRQ
ncbi:MAG TPA: hypothetical protein VJL29_15495 [Thermoguttaceae bacterium]|nr:hypothetical protein [Thermoguttaceae bacterium]